MSDKSEKIMIVIRITNNQTSEINIKIQFSDNVERTLNQSCVCMSTFSIERTQEFFFTIASQKDFAFDVFLRDFEARDDHRIILKISMRI
jgi:regulation of enolase protein 1 (concanavalin A-like superfamily)